MRGDGPAIAASRDPGVNGGTVKPPSHVPGVAVATPIPDVVVASPGADDVFGDVDGLGSDGGEGHSDGGEGRCDRGEGHSDAGEGQCDRVEGHSDRGEGHSDGGEGRRRRGGVSGPSLSLDVPGDAEEGVVTETKIVGVTEDGVIRKRSFKRKATKEELAHREPGYGNDKDHYVKIVEKVMSERFVTGTVEGLRERLKMIKYMHQDCLAMVSRWEKRRDLKIKAKRSKDPRIYVMAAGGCIMLLYVCWLVVVAIL